MPPASPLPPPQLAVGYTLDQIPNDITRKTPASFEPSIDYIITKIPKFAFEKFPGTKAELTTQASCSPGRHPSMHCAMHTPTLAQTHARHLQPYGCALTPTQHNSLHAHR